MKLYVIRHGQTDTNIQGLFNGRYDEDINDVGIKHAEIASEQFKKYVIDLIITSPMKRTVHTANIVNVHNVEIIKDKHFIERDVGILTLKSGENLNLQEYWKYDQSTYTGLEPIKDLQQRVFEGLDLLKSKYPDKIS